MTFLLTPVPRLSFATICTLIALLLQSFTLRALADDIIWYSGVDAAAAMAKGTSRFMLVEISAPWCPSCKVLERLMATKDISEWTNQRFVCVRVSADTPEGLALMRNFGMDGIPALLVFDSNGKFKSKMQGGPEDPEGYKYYLAKMAGGESAFANAGSAGLGDGTVGGANVRLQLDSKNYLSPSQQGSQLPPQGLQQPQPGFQTPQPSYYPQQQYYQYQPQGYAPQQRYYQYPAQGYRRQKQYKQWLQQGQSADTPMQSQQPTQIQQPGQIQQPFQQPGQFQQQ